MNRLLALLLLFTACADLDPATLIKRDRMLGAKVTVDGDATRAWPRPGEHATVTWVTASPGESPTFSWILMACAAATSTGMPACAGPAFATSQAAGPIPTLELVVPDDMGPTVVVTGAICASGTPNIDAATGMAACDDGSRVDMVSQHLFIATGEEMNHNPSIARPFTFDDAAWASGDCDNAVAPGSARRIIGVTFDASDREWYSSDDAMAQEDLQLAAFATAGEVLQQHTYVDDDQPTRVALEWDPPSTDDVPPEGMRVTFHFVVRDMRGGLDATTREICVR